MSRTLVDTGIQWIGKIPSDWDIVKVNKLFFRRKEVNTDTDPTVLSLARSGVKVRDISTNEGQIAESYDNYHKVYFGDLMLNPMDLVSGANCSMSEVEGVISPAYINLAKKEDCNPKYYDYFFKNQYWVNAMFIHGKGVSFDNRWTMNAETIMDYKIPLPSIEEQNKIVNYLNDKCSKIDHTIEDNNKIIELLEEYKNALLEEKSMNFSDSITVKNVKLKKLFNYQGGFAFDSSKFHTAGKNQVLRLGNVKSDKLILDANPVFVNDDYSEKASNCRIQKDDILFTMTGTKGKKDYFYTVIIDDDNYKPNLFINQRVGIFRKKDGVSLNMKYYNYLFKVPKIRNYIFLFETGTANQGNIGIDVLNEIKLPFPMVTIQNKIVQEIDNSYRKIDSVIKYRRKINEKLEEYKKSLIYEVVTGKKEV